MKSPLRTYITGMAALSFLAGIVCANMITTEAVADTFIRGTEAAHGADTDLRAKNYSTDRVAIFRFDTTGITMSLATDISLDLYLHSYDTDTSPTFSIYGVTSGSTLQNFTEASFVRADSGAFGSPLVLDSGFFFDPNAAGDEDALGDFTVTAAGMYTINTPNMLSFAQASTDQSLTFAMVREGNDTQNQLFASRENESFAGPTLYLQDSVIPEPSTLALFGAGVCILVSAHRRKMRV